MHALGAISEVGASASFAVGQAVSSADAIINSITRTRLVFTTRAGSASFASACHTIEEIASFAEGASGEGGVTAGVAIVGTGCALTVRTIQEEARLASTAASEVSASTRVAVREACSADGIGCGTTGSCFIETRATHMTSLADSVGKRIAGCNLPFGRITGGAGRANPVGSATTSRTLIFASWAGATARCADCIGGGSAGRGLVEARTTGRAGTATNASSEIIVGFAS